MCSLDGISVSFSSAYIVVLCTDTGCARILFPISVSADPVPPGAYHDNDDDNGNDKRGVMTRR